MSKGVIIHLDNDEENVLTPSRKLFDQSGFDLEYLTCTSEDEFKKLLSDNGSRVRGLIFDLLNKEPSQEELSEKDAAFLQSIKLGFMAYNIPVFIFSGYLPALGTNFQNNGTVYKFDKGNDQISDVFEKFKFLNDSGFIDVFCPGGILEIETKDELHKAFINQFSKNSQIEEVIKSIQASTPETQDKSERVKKVFKRIAIKSLATDLLSPVADSKDKVHPIEHFYTRQSNLKVWTGDIWKQKTQSRKVLVLTPRCDFAIGKAKNIMVCDIEASPKFPLDAKPEKLIENLNKYLVDNIDGKAKRYIPSSIFFVDGGMANLASHDTILFEDFINDFEYMITLSDDLTNEIIGKFAYYFLRTGITNINEKEFEAIIKAINNSQDAKK